MPEDKPGILVTRHMPENVEARISRDYQATLNPDDRLFSSAEMLDMAQRHDGILCCSTEKFSADVISALPESVKILATFSVGYEHIDIPAARTRGLKVTNTPDVLTDATADVAMLCLLAAARRGSEGDRLVRAEQWQGWYTTRGFGMQIHYHNRSRLGDELEQGATFHETLESLLAVSDFFSINAPSSAETLKFLNAERIALLPDGAVVANTARGNMVDDEALIAALQSGKLAAAGLDVFDGEPNVHPGYRSLDNVFLLPHLGSATHETRDAMGFCCLDNLDAFFSGKTCPSPLT